MRNEALPCPTLRIEFAKRSMHLAVFPTKNEVTPSFKNPQHRQHDWKGDQGILCIKNSSPFTKRAPTKLKMERRGQFLHVVLISPCPNILSCEPHPNRSTPQMGAKRCGPVVNFLLCRLRLLSGREREDDGGSFVVK